MLFHYNNEEEKRSIPNGPLSAWSVFSLSISVWVFSRDSGFLLHPEDVSLGCIYIVPA